MKTRARPTCYACQEEMLGVIILMAEFSESGGIVLMHETCANQPWPLYEVGRTTYVPYLDDKLPKQR